jgi:hypothetical protein
MTPGSSTSVARKEVAVQVLGLKNSDKGTKGRKEGRDVAKRTSTPGSERLNCYEYEVAVRQYSGVFCLLVASKQ